MIMFSLVGWLTVWKTSSSWNCLWLLSLWVTACGVGLASLEMIQEWCGAICIWYSRKRRIILEIILLFLYLNVSVTIPLVQSVHLGRLILFKFDALTTKSSSPAGTEIVICIINLSREVSPLLKKEPPTHRLNYLFRVQASSSNLVIFLQNRERYLKRHDENHTSQKLTVTSEDSYIWSKKIKGFLLCLILCVFYMIGFAAYLLPVSPIFVTWLIKTPF